jgi:hypothetical protein
MDVQQQVERYQMNDRLSVSLYRKLRADDPYKAKGGLLLEILKVDNIEQSRPIRLLGPDRAGLSAP